MRDREVVVSREPLALAREVVRIEAQAVAALADRLDGGALDDEHGRSLWSGWVGVTSSRARR